jgi:hypothetical protein
MRHRVYLFRHDVHTTITPDGLLRSVQIHNKTYGPGDADPKSERVEVREGHLTPQQMGELAAMFEGWESYATTRYGGVPDGGEIELRYGDKTVAGGSATPERVWEIDRHINELTRKMPVVKEGATRPGV